MPESFAPGWRLVNSGPLPPGEVPPAIEAAGLRRALKAEYKSAHTLEVTVFEMGAQSSAFELVQRWRPEEGKLALYSGSLFVTLHSPGLDHAALGEAANSLEEALKAANQ